MEARTVGTLAPAFALASCTTASPTLTRASSSSLSRPLAALGILALVALSARSIPWVSCDGIVQFSLFLRFFLLLLLQLFSALFSCVIWFGLGFDLDNNGPGLLILLLHCFGC